MAKATSCRLVVDASIAQAAGGEDASAEVSKSCRDALQAILDVCHRLVFTEEMRREWNEHQSKFALSWRKAMVARKKMDLVLVAGSFDDAWQQIEELSGREKDTDIMKKDFHLIEAALASDHRLLSLDEEVKALFDESGRFDNSPRPSSADLLY